MINHSIYWRHKLGDNEVQIDMLKASIWQVLEIVLE